jgi:hypothetical protein
MAPPIVTLLSNTISYIENYAPVIIDSGATITDIDSLNFDTGTLIIRLVTGVNPADRLSIRNQGNSSGQIGLDGRIINYGGTAIGTLTGGIGSDLVITFNSAATPTAAQALLQNITYSNVSETPAGSRTVEVVVTDGSGGISNTATTNITLTPVNDAPVISNTVFLYNGATDTLPRSASTTPNAKGWIYSSTPGAAITATGGVTNLNTTASPLVQAGFANITQTLNNTTGYTVSFTAQVLAESHTGSDKNNDGLDDRAGFSTLIVSSDRTKAIELDFWENRIWAQDDGTTQADPKLQPGDSPQSNFRTLFTQAESVAYDTKTQPVKYDLAVQGSNYTLFANGNSILSGKMRDYTAFSSSPANLPYRLSNNIFFGDNTTSAQASVNLAKVAVTTNTNLPTLTATEGTALKISNLSITDLDAGTSNITVNLSVGKGYLTVNNVAGGVVSSDITSNGTGNVILTGTLNQINTTLAANAGLTYQLNPSVFGTDTLNISVNDGIDTTQKSETINIQRVFNGSGTRDPITGTSGDDLITPGRGAKTLTGGNGNDQFIFNSQLDAGSTITDFTPGSDKIVLTQLLNSIVPSGYDRSNTLADGYFKFVQGSNANHTTLQIDPDGSGPLIARPFVHLNNITLIQLNNVKNFVF